jgi:hypothetical protein
MRRLVLVRGECCSDERQHTGRRNGSGKDPASAAHVFLLMSNGSGGWPMTQYCDAPMAAETARAASADISHRSAESAKVVVPQRLSSDSRDAPMPIDCTTVLLICSDLHPLKDAKWLRRSMVVRYIFQSDSLMSRIASALKPRLEG